MTPDELHPTAAPRASRDIQVEATDATLATIELKPARLRNAPAAAYVGMTPRALAALRYRGGGPRYRRSGTAQNSIVYYLVADLDVWMTERSQQGDL